jgi:hypothetical protein
MACREPRASGVRVLGALRHPHALHTPRRNRPRAACLRRRRRRRAEQRMSIGLRSGGSALPGVAGGWCRCQGSPEQHCLGFGAGPARATCTQMRMRVRVGLRGRMHAYLATPAELYSEAPSHERACERAGPARGMVAAVPMAHKAWRGGEGTRTGRLSDVGSASGGR